MIEYCLKFVFHSSRSSHYLQGRVDCSVESIVEVVGLSKLLDRHLVSLNLSILTATSTGVAALASAATTATAGWSPAGVSANLSTWHRRRWLPLLSLPSKVSCSGCPCPSCSCSSSSGCSCPDSFQASKSSSLSSSASGIS